MTDLKENRTKYEYHPFIDPKLTSRYSTFYFLIIIFTCLIINMQAFKKDEVVPDVVRQAPQKELKITFNGGRNVALGNELTPTQVKDQPEIEYEADADSYYTIVMTDPDAPSRKNPVRREYLHWLVGNVPGNKIANGEVITAYFGSAPPKGSGLHRYVFLVYKQPKKLTFDEPRHSNTDGNRGNFSVQKFADKYNLGTPVYGNFYQAQFDDYVPTAHKKLGLGKKK